MSNRHLARTLAMQSLFLWDFQGSKKENFKKIIADIFANFAPSFNDQGFVDRLIKGVMDKQSEIDEYITRYATEWPLDQITIVDRNILRIGVFELIYDADIPSKVAINEAIEIAKTFGSESSGKFVNGVLGAIYKNILEEGKEKAIDKEDSKKDVVEKKEELEGDGQVEAEVEKGKMMDKKIVESDDLSSDKEKE